jgi:predicted RNase H-like HicB family nuclease
MTATEYTVRVHEEGGSLWAEVVELPGCFASGDSLDQLSEALSESIALYLDDPLRPIEPLRIGEMRVTVAA